MNARGWHRAQVIVWVGWCLLWGGDALAQSPGPRRIRFDADLQIGAGDPALGLEQEEPSVAVSPVNPDNLVAAFHDFFDSPFSLPCTFANSQDGGLTWTVRGIAPSLTSDVFCSDPALAADTQGNFYLGYLTQVSRKHSGVVVAKSTDGGSSFQSVTVAFTDTSSLVSDKEYIAVDTNPQSPFRDTIYLAYSLFDPTFTSSFIAVQVSRDGNASWSDPLPISPTGATGEFLTFALPVVSPDGTAYIFYLHADPAGGSSRIRLAKSLDGGASWSAPADVASNLPTPGLFQLRNADPSSGGFRANSGAAAAATSGGVIHVVWTDFPNGSCSPSPDPTRPTLQLCENADVRMSVSRDAGASWSAPVKITDDSGATDQFFPWVAAHPDGLVSVVWLDRRLDSANVFFDLFYTNTTDGRRFLRNARVSTAGSDPAGMTFIGDYNNVAVTAEAVIPVWVDIRAGRRVFSARGSLSRR